MSVVNAGCRTLLQVSDDVHLTSPDRCFAAHLRDLARTADLAAFEHVVATHQSAGTEVLWREDPHAVGDGLAVHTGVVRSTWPALEGAVVVAWFELPGLRTTRVDLHTTPTVRLFGGD